MPVKVAVKVNRSWQMSQKVKPECYHITSGLSGGRPEYRKGRARCETSRSPSKAAGPIPMVKAQGENGDTSHPPRCTRKRTKTLRDTIPERIRSNWIQKNCEVPPGQPGDAQENGGMRINWDRRRGKLSYSGRRRGKAGGGYKKNKKTWNIGTVRGGSLAL